MALIYDDVEGMMAARHRGASFTSVLTVGRLVTYLHAHEVRDLGGLEGYQFGEYADRTFRELLGTEDLVSLDNSDYEGATWIHDMNEPLPAELCGRFDAVVDAGSLEHVFNVPVALANVMQAARVGGRVFLTTPANNLCGHGFYQFSPELMFRVFCPENGFEVQEATILRCPFPSIESVPVRRVFRVADPAVVRSRVGLQARDAAMLHIEAVRITDVRPFRAFPQQSDYRSMWEGSAPSTSTRSLRNRVKALIESMPDPIARRLKAHYLRSRFSFRNTNSYERVR